MRSGGQHAPLGSIQNCRQTAVALCQAPVLLQKCIMHRRGLHILVLEEGKQVVAQDVLRPTVNFVEEGDVLAS